MSKFLFVALACLFTFAAILPSPSVAQEEPSGASQTLIEILQDEAARAELIAQLEAAAPEAPPEPVTERTVAQEIVSEVTSAVTALTDVVNLTIDEFARMARLLNDVSLTGLTVSAEFITLAMVISAVIVASLVGKMALDRVIAHNRITALTPARQRLGLIILYALLRLLSLAVAWAVGYSVASWRSELASGPAPTEAIFLTTVLVFGLCRIGLRLIVTPDAEHEPTLSHLPPRAQEAIYRRLRGFVGALVFSFMFILPLVRQWIGFVTERPVRTLLATILLVMAITMLKRIVAVLEMARDTPGVGSQGTGAMVSRGVQSAWHVTWPPLAAIYIIYCWLIAVTRPRELSEIVFGGTITSLFAVALALGALWMLRQASVLHIPLPHGIDRIMPDLARRISRTSRWLAGVLAGIAMVFAVLTAFAAWGLIDLESLLYDPDLQQVFWRLVSAILLATTLAVLWAVIASFVDQRLRGATLLDNNRARTLLGLFRNAFTIFVSVLGAMVVLSQLGVDIAPLLAGAGVIGLAIGFGSQKLVQDIITGVFIQLDNAMNEGDVVTVAGITGGVEKLSIRSVRLRTLDGSMHIVPFSSVDTVTNLTRDFSFHVAELGVAYKEKVPAVIGAMQAAFDTLRAGAFGADIIDDFEMHGVTALGDSSVVVRARIKTKPGKQWAIGREYTALVKDEFDSRGIEIPFPHRQLMLPPEFIEAMARRPGEDAKVIEA